MLDRKRNINTKHMNKSRRKMMVDSNYSYAYGATSRAMAFKSAADHAANIGYVDLSKHYRGLMRIWSRCAAQDIQRLNSND